MMPPRSTGRVLIRWVLDEIELTPAQVYKLGEMNQLKVDNIPQRKVAAVVNTVAIKHVT